GVADAVVYCNHYMNVFIFYFFFSSRRRHTRSKRDWSSDGALPIFKLIEAGANVFRFNFSHGDHEEHLGRLNLVHEAEKKTGKTVGFLLDTKGAEIRTTVQKEGKIHFAIGDEVRISMDDSIEGTKEKIAVTYPGLYYDV